MAKVTFTNQAEKIEMTVEGASGDSLLEIALNNDVPLQSACGGFCSCTTCHVHSITRSETWQPSICRAGASS